MQWNNHQTIVRLPLRFVSDKTRITFQLQITKMASMNFSVRSIFTHKFFKVRIRAPSSANKSSLLSCVVVSATCIFLVKKSIKNKFGSIQRWRITLPTTATTSKSTTARATNNSYARLNSTVLLHCM